MTNGRWTMSFLRTRRFRQSINKITLRCARVKRGFYLCRRIPERNRRLDRVGLVLRLSAVSTGQLTLHISGRSFTLDDAPASGGEYVWEPRDMWWRDGETVYMSLI